MGKVDPGDKPNTIEVTVEVEEDRIGTEYVSGLVCGPENGTLRYGKRGSR